MKRESKIWDFAITFSVALTFLVASLVSGCAWLTPTHVVDVATIAACVLAHDHEPVQVIAAACGIEDEKQIVDILSAEKAAIARDRAAACR